MTCDELREQYELYLLGLAEEPEASEITAHLRDNCPNCRQGLRQALQVNSSLLAGAPDTAPPARLRRRVLASIGVERPWWGHALRWSPILAGLLLAVIGVSWMQQQTAAELEEARQALQRNEAEMGRLQTALQVINEPETRLVTFGAGAVQPPRGQVFVNRRRGVVLIAGNLPQVPAGRIYQMWLIPRGGQPRPAGLFQSNANGTAVHLQAGPVEVDQLGAVAVSVEPLSGSPAPTTQPLIVAPLGGG